MEHENTFYCPADARGEARLAAVTAGLWTAAITLALVKYPSWDVLFYFVGAVVVVGPLVKRWQTIRSGHLSADASGLTVQLADETKFYSWAEYDDLQWHGDASPGVLRLLQRAEDGNVRSAVTIPWHRFRTTSGSLLEGLERARRAHQRVQ